MGWLFTHRDKIPEQNLADWFIANGALSWNGVGLNEFVRHQKEMRARWESVDA